MCAEIVSRFSGAQVVATIQALFLWLPFKCKVPEEGPSLCHAGPESKERHCPVPAVKIKQKLIFPLETLFPHLQMKITLSYYQRAL